MEDQKLKHICKFCKKNFACGRSLGGHIRCHLPKSGYELRDTPKKTRRVASATTTVSSSSSLSSEIEAGKLTVGEINQCPGKSKSKSKRSRLVAKNSNSFVSEVFEEKQQEEVDIALCLIMLSRDVGPWGGGKNPLSRSSKNRRKNIEKGQEMETVFTAVNGEKLVFLASEHLKKGLKLKGIEVSENGFLSNDQTNKLSENKEIREELEDSAAYENVRKCIKMDEFQDSENGFLSTDQKSSNHEFGKIDEIGMNSELIQTNNPDKSHYMRSKFECTTCNKVFHSYQALGGHKASHKKLLRAQDCGATQSKRDTNKLIGLDEEQLQPPHCDDQFVTEIIGVGSSSILSKKVSQKHECMICFRVFPSGQALGGHKRSHLLASNRGETKTSKSIKTADVTERSSSSETRDMLYLYLPPIVHIQEEGNSIITTAGSSDSLVGLIKPHWWVENPHKHETFLSLISND